MNWYTEDQPKDFYFLDLVINQQEPTEITRPKLYFDGDINASDDSEVYR